MLHMKTPVYRVPSLGSLEDEDLLDEVLSENHIVSGYKPFGFETNSSNWSLVTSLRWL